MQREQAFPLPTVTRHADETLSTAGKEPRPRVFELARHQSECSPNRRRGQSPDFGSADAGRRRPATGYDVAP